MRERTLYNISLIIIIIIIITTLMDPQHETPTKQRTVLRRDAIWGVLMILAVMMFVLFGVRISMYDRVLMFEAMQRLGENPQAPDHSPDQVGVCMIVVGGGEESRHRVSEALRRVRGLYPFAPVYVHSPQPNHRHTVDEWGGVFSVYTPKLNVSTVVECLGSAARNTNTTLFMNERTLLLRRPMVHIPSGTVGLVGYNDRLPISATQRVLCDSAHVLEPNIVPAGSVLSSEWIRSVTSDAVKRISEWDKGLSHLIWCSGNRVAVDARIMRDASPRHRRHRHDLHLILQAAGEGLMTFLKI